MQSTAAELVAAAEEKRPMYMESHFTNRFKHVVKALSYIDSVS